MSVVDMTISGAGAEIAVSVGAARSDVLRKESTIVLMTLLPVVTVAIEKGENAGRQVSYYNVVRKIMPVGMWYGDSASLKLPKETLLSTSEECCVGLLQITSSGRIIGAAPWNFKSRQS
jgi:hypothetical protein